MGSANSYEAFGEPHWQHKSHLKGLQGEPVVRDDDPVWERVAMASKGYERAMWDQQVAHLIGNLITEGGDGEIELTPVGAMAAWEIGWERNDPVLISIGWAALRYFDDERRYPATEAA